MATATRAKKSVPSGTRTGASSVQTGEAMRPIGLRWQNFRSFENTGWFEVRPITVVIGPNNAGKTSLLLPILLLKQTLQSKDPEVALITRGSLANVGSFEDAVISHDSQKDISFGVRFHGHDARPQAKLRPVSDYPPGIWGASFRPSENDPSQVVLKRYEVRDPYGRRILARQRQRNGSFSVLGIELRQRSRRGSQAVAAAWRKGVRAARPDHFLFTQAQILRSVLSTGEDLPIRSDELEIPDDVVTYLRSVGEAESALRQLLQQVSYLGPVRRRPKRSYEISPEVPSDVGVGGEFAPELLYRESATRLRRPVERWLRKFHIANELEFSTLDHTAFSLFLRRGSKSPRVNFADAGFGVSQLLPLLVQGIVAPEKSLIIAEQPEIHLNPSQQLDMADFLVQRAQARRVFLIETHSEHLVMRLRRLIASGKLPAEDLALYFVELDGDRSQLKRVHVDSEGRIKPTEWPSGFFQEPLSEGLALASAQSRARRGARGSGG